jgi:hypothetical protein
MPDIQDLLMKTKMLRTIHGGEDFKRLYNVKYWNPPKLGNLWDTTQRMFKFVVENWLNGLVMTQE